MLDFTVEVLAAPTDVTVVNSSTTTLTIQWNVSDLMSQIVSKLHLLCPAHPPPPRYPLPSPPPPAWIPPPLSLPSPILPTSHASSHLLLYPISPSPISPFHLLPLSSSHPLPPTHSLPLTHHSNSTVHSSCLSLLLALSTIPPSPLSPLPFPISSSPLSPLPFPLSPFPSPLSPLQSPSNLNGTSGQRYRISYQSDTDSYTRARYLYPSGNASTLNATISGLQRATEYTIQVRLEVYYSTCYSYLYGNYSEPIFASTNATSEEFYIRMQLCSFASLTTIYLGRHLIIS